MISVNPSYIFHLLPPNKLNPPPGNTDSVPPPKLSKSFIGGTRMSRFFLRPQAE